MHPTLTIQSLRETCNTAKGSFRVFKPKPLQALNTFVEKFTALNSEEATRQLTEDEFLELIKILMTHSSGDKLHKNIEEVLAMLDCGKEIGLYALRALRKLELNTPSIGITVEIANIILSHPIPMDKRQSLTSIDMNVLMIPNKIADSLIELRKKGIELTKEVLTFFSRTQAYVFKKIMDNSPIQTTTQILKAVEDSLTITPGLVECMVVFNKLTSIDAVLHYLPADVEAMFYYALSITSKMHRYSTLDLELTSTSPTIS